MTRPLYVSHATPDYRDEAGALIATLDEHALDYSVQLIPCLGSWQANTQAKAITILGALRANPGRAVVWLDADARVRQDPILFDELGDGIEMMAAHWRGRHLLSGTLWFSPHAAPLVERWIAMNEARPNTWDQENLADAIGDAPVVKLPAAYCRICDAHDMGEDVVIEHMQASRRLKRIVNA